MTQPRRACPREGGGQRAQAPRRCRHARPDARLCHSAGQRARSGWLPRCSEGGAGLFPFLERVIADGAYQGRATARAVRRAARARLEIVKRSDAAKGFVVLPKRWIVERTFGWLGRCRRLAKDFEALTRTHLAFVQLAM